MKKPAEQPDTCEDFSEIHKTMKTGRLWCQPDGEGICFLDSDGSTDEGCRLAPGTLMAACINGEWYPGILDYVRCPNGCHEWVLSGTSFRDTAMNGLHVRVPLYLQITRDDGAVFTLGSPGCLSSKEVACTHFYRYSDMPVMDAVWMHVEYVLRVCHLKDEDRQRYKESLRNILDGVEIDTALWQLVEQARDACGSYAEFYEYGEYTGLLNDWVEQIRKQAGLQKAGS